ncbi:MAG: Ig-like domain-containing protein [Myxococcota bacterium]
MSVSPQRWLVGSVVSAAVLLVPPLAAAEPSTQLDSQARGTYVWVPDNTTAGPTPTADGEPHVLYLNRCEGGTTITAGWPDDNVANRSGILNGTVNFPPFAYGDTAWEQVMEHTRQIFSPFNVTITDVDPSPAPHDEAIVCGSGNTAGWGGAGGVAPFTCGVIDKSITFTFPESLGGHPRTIAEVIAQEAAHAWGLEHEYKCEDPMSYLSGCGDKTYQDGDYPCGEYSARACECGGNTQNSFQYIMGLFGPAVPDLEAPSALIVSPADGDIFGVDDSFDIVVDVNDDIGVTHVALYLDGELSTESVAEPFGPWGASGLPQGVHELYIEATDDAGKTTVSPVVTIEVSVDGAPPAGGDEGEGSGDGGSAGDDGWDDDGFGDDGGGFSGGNGGALPPGFGSDPSVQGCACSSTEPNPFDLGWASALFGLLVASRRRRTSRR